MTALVITMREPVLSTGGGGKAFGPPGIAGVTSGPSYPERVRVREKVKEKSVYRS